MSNETCFGEQSRSANSPGGDSREEMVSDRRLVLKGSLAAFAALGAGTMSNIAKASQAGGLTDVDILNFALNLEYLEAEFYLRAVTGMGLSQSETTGTGRQGNVKGGSMVPFRNTAVQQFATEIANDERAHVDFLRAALGSSAVAEPAIDFTAAFDLLAQAAGLDDGSGFDPFSHEDAFIKGAFVFEDVGVTAYHGAAQYIQSKSYLDAAAGILAVEAYHAGIIRSLMYERGFYGPAHKISNLRQTLSNTKETTDQGILLKGVANLVPSDKDGIAFERTPAEVLNIVYEGGKSAGFGFFPHKMNGAIR